MFFFSEKNQQKNQKMFHEKFKFSSFSSVNEVRRTLMDIITFMFICSVNTINHAYKFRFENVREKKNEVAVEVE